jgi:hypothetical protein
MSPTCRLVIACMAVAVFAAPWRMALAQDVTIYRCVDAKGKVTLRDTPCAKSEKQETRTMTRPTDAPRKPKPAVAPAPAQAEPVVVYQNPREVYAPPRPLYECITPDGVSYTSDTGEGNPRYVPLWTLGYNYDFGGGTVTGVNYIGPYAGMSTFVRDTCYMLPQDEVCARTRDRRDAIRTRFFNAMPSERDVLRVEERSLNARLANDCGGG